MFSTDNTYTLTLPGGEQIIFGSDNSSSDWVGILSSSGITSSIEVRDAISNISKDDGTVIGSSYWGTRSIVADITVIDTDPATRADKLAKLQKSTKLLRSTGTLSWTEKNTAATQKQVPVRLQTFPTLAHTSGPIKTYQLSLLATQPHIESGGSALTLANGATATNHTVNNPGDWDAYPVITIKAPLTTGTITNSTTGQSFTLTNCGLTVATPPAVNVITINTNPAIKTVLLNSTNIFDKVNIGSDFIKLAPGNNVVRLDATSGGTSATKIEMSWRGAWL